jgi:hypothetical protein
MLNYHRASMQKGKQRVMEPKYMKEWLSLAEAIELVGGDAANLELAIQEAKVTPQVADAQGASTYLLVGQMGPMVRLDVARDLIVIQDTHAPWAKDVEHTAPKFSRSEIASAFGLHPTPQPDVVAQPAPKKRPLNAGGRPSIYNWQPIDIYITAFIFDNDLPNDPTGVSELTDRVLEYIDETFTGDLPGREEIHGRVKKILNDFRKALDHVRGATIS